MVPASVSHVCVAIRNALFVWRAVCTWSAPMDATAHVHEQARMHGAQYFSAAAAFKLELVRRGS